MKAKSLQRDIAKYNKTGAVILGVSVDSPDSHKEYCSKEGLTFKLLTDPGGKVSAQYGSTMDYKGTTMAARNTFLINPEGKIAKVYTSVKPAEHSDQVLKDLAELKKSRADCMAQRKQIDCRDYTSDKGCTMKRA